MPLSENLLCRIETESSAKSCQTRSSSLPVCVTRPQNKRLTYPRELPGDAGTPYKQQKHKPASTPSIETLEFVHT